jgi:hypothetical protein
MQNMPQLQRLECQGYALRADGIRAFQPALQAKRALVELWLPHGWLGDDGIRFLVDALVGNTTMKLLNICSNNITSAGLHDITRILELTRLEKISFF